MAGSMGWGEARGKMAEIRAFPRGEWGWEGRWKGDWKLEIGGLGGLTTVGDRVVAPALYDYVIF